MPVVFRIIYGCGLRVSEALALKTEDVNLSEKYIIIRDSKNDRDRVLPLSDSLTEIFLLYRGKCLSKNLTTKYFFSQQDGTRYAGNTVLPLVQKNTLLCEALHNKGKIERFFLTGRKRFLPLLTEKEYTSLEKLNQSFFTWLEKDYHRKIHSSLKMTPLDKYMSQISGVKTINDPEKLKMIFLKRAKRKVKHDGTISVNSKLYEVPPVLIGKKINIRFNPETYQDIFIYDNGKCIGKAEKVIYADNAHVKRKQNISFQDMIMEDDNDV